MFKNNDMEIIGHVTVVHPRVLEQMKKDMVTWAADYLNSPGTKNLTPHIAGERHQARKILAGDLYELAEQEGFIPSRWNYEMKFIQTCDQIGIKFP